MKTRLVGWRKLAGGLSPLLALGLILALSVPVVAQPPPVIPVHQFWGFTTTVCGTQVDPGTMVTVKAPDCAVEWTSFVNNAGAYGLNEQPDYPNNLLLIPEDDPQTVLKDGAVEDDWLEFWVMGKLAGQAQFVPDGFTELPLAVVEVDLTVLPSTNGEVTTPGEGVFPRPCGDPTNLVAEADTGYVFDEWTGDVGTVVDVNDPTTIIAMNGFYTIQANFIPVGAAHDLTVTSDGCCPIDVAFDLFIDQVPAGDSRVYNDIPFGTEVELDADVPLCCVFDGWEVDAVGVGGDPIYVTMDTDHAAVATCTPVGPVTLTVDVVGEGDVEVNAVAPLTYPTGYPFDCCTDVDLEAIPAQGWVFTGWSNGLTGSTNPTSIHMDADITVIANFAPVGATYLTVSTTAGGTVTDPGVGTFPYDTAELVDIVAVPECGFVFVNWTGDVGTVADVNDATTTITMNDDYSITANFVSAVLMTVNLVEGFNTFSTPIALDPCCDTWGELAALSGIGDDIEIIYYYYNDGISQNWGNVMTGFHDEVTPLEGFYVKMKSGGTILIVPNPGFTPPPAKELAAGLNLFGLASLVDRNVESALVDVYEVTGGLTGYSKVLDPPVNVGSDFVGGVFVRDDVVVPTMRVSKSYWVIMINPGMVYGETSTPVIP
jgi:uncharacterized repeat protein (TIGR02543 family)